MTSEQIKEIKRTLTELGAGNPLSCRGKFVPYAVGAPKGLRGKSRFFRLNPDGTFESDRQTWKDIESWEYEDETK